MTNEQHPITPPTELMQVWEGKYFRHALTFDELLTEVYTAGRNHELEACCDWMTIWISAPEASQLRAARRPKDPSLKEQALNVLAGLEKRCDLQCNLDTIRRALEALPND